MPEGKLFAFLRYISLASLIASLLQQVVGFVGRLAPEKGAGLFLAVAEAIAELIPSAHFVVVGDGPLRPALEAMAFRLGLDR